MATTVEEKLKIIPPKEKTTTIELKGAKVSLEEETKKVDSPRDGHKKPSDNLFAECEVACHIAESVKKVGPVEHE